MSSYLGFEPTDRPNYFFVSYNSEDIDRIAPIAKMMVHGNVPLWYDYGLEYGEKWESQIAYRIRDAQAVILFFTKGILTKENSYVRKEYEMATKYFGKKVYVVMLDEIRNQDVPVEKVPWWIDVQENQSIQVPDPGNIEKTLSLIMEAIGMSSHEEKMNLLVQNYKALYDLGEFDEAERYLLEYMHGQSLRGKAQLIANIVRQDAKGIFSDTVSQIIDRPYRPLRFSNDKTIDRFFESRQIELQDTIFTVGNEFVFHRGNRGDAHIMGIWKNDENIHVTGGLIEASISKVYYDRYDDIIYVCYYSDKEEMTEDGIQEETFLNVTTVEDPLGAAICNDFRWL